MSAGEWAQLGALALLWGGSFFFVAVAVPALPPLTIVTLRVGLAALALLAACRAMGVPLPRGWRVWVAFFGMGLLNNVLPFSLITWGQGHIGGGAASILNAATPLFGVVVAHFLTEDEKLTGGRLVGVLIGIAGVAVMVGGAALQSLGAHLLAQLACLGAGLGYAFAGVFGRRFRAMGIAPLATALGQVTASTLLLLPVALLLERPWLLAPPPATALAAVGALALLSTALAYLLYFRLLATAGATNIMLVTFLVPVSAILLSVLVLGEVLEARQLGGMALIALGLAAIDGRAWPSSARRR